MTDTKAIRPEAELLGEIGRYHVRRIKKPNGQQVFEVRERVKSDCFEGYTRKGIVLAIPGDVEKLRSFLESVLPTREIRC